MKIRKPDSLTVFTEDKSYFKANTDFIEVNDINLSLNLKDNELGVRISGDKTPLKYLRLRWNFSDEEKRHDPIKILGDNYERGYSDLRWAGIEPERMMPWYMLVSNGSDRIRDTAGRHTEGFGVKVQCNAIITWQYDEAGISMWADIRNGGMGVILSRKSLDVCSVVFRDYYDMSAFDAGRRFCRAMCPTTKLADHKVYGSNNWYYAYGKSSREDILSDTEIVVAQCKGISNLPYMVIDDGWQVNNTEAPWTGRDNFGDMKTLADEMKHMNVRPGIWVRYLANTHHVIPEATDEWMIDRGERKVVLDPSHPDVIEYVKKVTRTIREWGYDLIKHDYSACDTFGGFAPLQYVGNQYARDGWHFYDRSKTTAQITVEFYRAIREAAGDDCVIIGCNTISHLCAGMCELNRTGDDTSGHDWKRTRKMGVNTLAFRMIQNGIFYMADADCVGIQGPIPWELNKKWLDILSKSGSPLFVSCKPGVLNEKETEELREAWKINSVQENDCRPLDWMENMYPAHWLIDGKEEYYNWFTEEGIDSFDPNAPRR